MTSLLNQLELESQKTDCMKRTPAELSVRIKFFDHLRYNSYEPHLHSAKSFTGHLEAWLTNYRDRLSLRNDETLNQDIEQDLVHLLGFVTQIAFVNDSEIKALCLAAFQEHIKPWLFRRYNISLFTSSLTQELHNIIRNTMFCSVTDSMNIATFVHTNDLGHSVQHRPNIRLFTESEAHMNAFVDDIQRHKVRQLVVLEDFVGTGGQSFRCLEKLKELHIPILFVPLIILHSGEKKLKTLQDENFSISPVILVPQKHAIHCECDKNEPDWHAHIRQASFKLLSPVEKEIQNFEKGLSIIGFKQCGEYIVLHSNCPNNSLCIIHCTIGNSPLFYRVTRSS